MTPEFIQKRIDRLAQPDGEAVMGRGGAEWARTHVLRCPWCPRTFFGFEPVEHPLEPYRVHEPTNPLDGGMRETCGDPSCHEHESLRQWKRAKAYRESLPGGKPAEKPQEPKQPEKPRGLLPIRGKGF